MRSPSLGLAGAIVGLVAGLFVIPRMFGAADRGPTTPDPPPPPAEIAKSVTLVEFARGLSEPLALVAEPGDTRLWVAEKTGAVKVLGTDGKIAGAPVIDLAGMISQGSEQGLLGLAFHPDFATNRLFYVNYTDVDGDTRVAEYRESEGKGAVVRELLHVKQPFSNHNGGNVVMGPDRRLWVGMGDGGSAGDPRKYGQNPAAFLGKMLRIDISQESPKARVALLGLRNPWRFSFDRKTGDLYIGDVGQNRFEEVTVLAAGTTSGNLGWNVREGYACFEPRFGCEDAFTPPAVTYRTGHHGCTVTGGAVYRGRALPALDGVYFYADFCTALIRSFRWKGTRGTPDGSAVADHWDWKRTLDPRDKLAEISSFGEDAEGELYLVSLGGTIYKFVPAAPAPLATTPAAATTSSPAPSPSPTPK